jgi:hypothetical protein
LGRLLVREEVDLVLDDHDLLHPDDIERVEVLAGLRLGDLLVTRDEQ